MTIVYALLKKYPLFILKLRRNILIIRSGVLNKTDNMKLS